PNNAADGDLLIAWALLEGGARWRDSTLSEASRGIRADISRRLLREIAGRKILLPGVSGFEQDKITIVNPSYLVAPALVSFAKADPSGPWRRALSDGYALIREARFGAQRMTPDWLVLHADGSMDLPSAWPPRAGFEAIRVPLYLVWAKAPDDIVEPVSAYWKALADRPRPP